MPNPATGTMALRITPLCYPIGLRFDVEKPHAGRRLDHHLTELLPQYSRARIQGWIKHGNATVNGAPAKSSYTLREGDAIEVEPAELTPLHATAEAIPLRILYSDSAVVAIDKPAGMVVHAERGATRARW